MTPSDIITRAIQDIPGIRLPRVRHTVERILLELEENGYKIGEKSQWNTSSSSSSAPF